MLGRTILMTYKHKTHAVDSAGKVISNADVDFYIDDVNFLSFSSCRNIFSLKGLFQMHLGNVYRGHIMTSILLC